MQRSWRESSTALAPSRGASSCGAAEVGAGFAGGAFYGTCAGIELAMVDGLFGSVGLGDVFFGFPGGPGLCPFTGSRFGHAFFLRLFEENTESQPERYFGVETLEK